MLPFYEDVENYSYFQRVNIDITVSVVFVTVTRLCCCSAKAAIDSK